VGQHSRKDDPSGRRHRFNAGCGVEPSALGAFSFGSNYGLQPGFVTYPLMAVSGLASIPSTAEHPINNVRVAEQSVPAGPFTISNLADDDRGR